MFRSLSLELSTLVCQYPDQSEERSATNMVAPYNWSFVWSGVPLAWFFMSYLYRKFPAWWNKYCCTFKLFVQSGGSRLRKQISFRSALLLERQCPESSSSSVSRSQVQDSIGGATLFTLADVMDSDVLLSRCRRLDISDLL
jgi:hypothetical protein